MKRIACLVLLCYSAPLLAQDRVAVCGVDVLCAPAKDPAPVLAPPPVPTQPPAGELAPLWLAIQNVATKQAAADVRVGAIETRVMVLEAKPSGPSAWAVVGNVLTNPLVLAVIGAAIGRYAVPAK